MGESLGILFFFVILCVRRVELVVEFIGVEEVFYFVVNEDEMDFVVVLEFSCNVYNYVYNVIMVLGVWFNIVVDGVFWLDVEDGFVNSSVDSFDGLFFVCLV